MDQLNLFAAEAPPERAAYRPDPDKVRARLERILGQARGAEVAPWPSTQVNLYRTIVPQMTDWLPEGEAAAYRAAFKAELARFGLAA